MVLSEIFFFKDSKDLHLFVLLFQNALIKDLTRYLKTCVVRSVVLVGVNMLMMFYNFRAEERDGMLSRNIGI
jgi:hypothetical protein